MTNPTSKPILDYGTQPRHGRLRKYLRRSLWAGLILLLLALLFLVIPITWLYCDWRQDQAVYDQIHGSSKVMNYKKLDLPVISRILPSSCDWLLNRANYIALDYPEDAGLQHLKDFHRLSELYLHGPTVTDASLEHLRTMKNLHWLRISDASITPAGVANLKNSLPNCQVECPDLLLTAALRQVKQGQKTLAQIIAEFGPPAWDTQQMKSPPPVKIVFVTGKIENFGSISYEDFQEANRVVYWKSEAPIVPSYQVELEVLGLIWNDDGNIRVFRVIVSPLKNKHP